METRLHKRFIKFFYKAINSEKNAVSTCATLALSGSQSSACNSLNYIARKYQFDKYKMTRRDLQYFIQVVNSYVRDPCMLAQEQQGELIRELCLARDGKLHTNFTRQELCDSIEFFCIA